MPDDSTRSHTSSIEIRASKEEVWRALTEAEEIVKWFSPEARVTPGAGGTTWGSWGAGMEGTARIEIWEPGAHLRTLSERPGPQRVAVDYLIESKGGSTVLRVVQSGFGASAEWDAEYESTRLGWPMFLETMRWGLERHRGVAGVQATNTIFSPFSREETWRRLLSANGLNLPDSKAGERYEANVATGDHLTGVMHHFNHAGYLRAVIENWNDAYLTVFCEPMGGKAYVTATLILYGEETRHADSRRASWRTMLEKLYPAS